MEERVYIGYTPDEWGEIFDVLWKHEDTQEVAIKMADDMAESLETPPDTIRIHRPQEWLTAWLEFIADYHNLK